MLFDTQLAHTIHTSHAYLTWLIIKHKNKHVHKTHTNSNLISGNCYVKIQKQREQDKLPLIPNMKMNQTTKFAYSQN